MGLSSHAPDFTDALMSLNARLNSHSPSTSFMFAQETNYRVGIMSGALLIIDSSLRPCDGSLLICDICGEYGIKRYRRHPQPHLENVDNGAREELPPDIVGQSPTIFGVITHIVNDARSGEFDDYPVM